MWGRAAFRSIVSFRRGRTLPLRILGHSKEPPVESRRAGSQAVVSFRDIYTENYLRTFWGACEAPPRSCGVHEFHGLRGGGIKVA